MDAAQMFLLRHKQMHARVDRLADGLTEEQMRECFSPKANPLAWIFWHIARSEDAFINLLIGDGVQVLDDVWLGRLRVTRRDVGTGMTMAEVVSLSAEIDLVALQAYWSAVGEQTATVVAALTPATLDEVISPERARWAVVDENMVQGSMGERFQRLLQGWTKGYCLVYLPLAHIHEHIGEADLLRGLLGLPRRF